MIVDRLKRHVNPEADEQKSRKETGHAADEQSIQKACTRMCRVIDTSDPFPVFSLRFPEYDIAQYVRDLPDRIARLQYLFGFDHGWVSCHSPKFSQ